jgi:hypothetical protein
VIVPRNEVKEACDQAAAQKPVMKNRSANARRQGFMRTTSKEIELTRGLCSLLAESFLLAEARMPFRSYKSAEFSVSRRYY